MIAYTTTPRAELPPVFLSTYHLSRAEVLTTPTSSTWSATNRIIYVPFTLSVGVTVYRYFWLNGTVVGTDKFAVGVYSSAFNLITASPFAISAGTVNLCQFVNPDIHGTMVIEASNNADATSYTTASVTLKAGVLYLLSVHNAHGSSAHAVSSIDNGPTFTSRSTTQFNGTLNRVSIWSAVPTSDYTGTLVINFGANTETGCIWSLNAFYHADTATTDGVVQNAVGTGNSTTPLATLAAFGSANNATFGAMAHASTNVGAPESASYIELSDETSTTPSQAMQTYFRPDNDTTVSSTITSAQWGACAVEIKSLGTGGFYLSPGRYYMAMWGSGTTATVFRASNSANQPQGLYYETNAGGLPTTGTPVDPAGAVSAYLPVFGLALRATDP